MTVVRPKGWQCSGCSSNDSIEQYPIQFEDEGVALGGEGTVRIVNFVGANVEATRSGNTITVTISGGGSSFEVEDYTGFEAGGGTFPAQVEGKFYRLVFASPGTPIDLNGVQYTHNTLIFWHADAALWGSISANFGT